MDQNELLRLLASAVLIVALTALGLYVVRLVRKRLLAWTTVVDAVRDPRRKQLTTIIQLLHWIVVVALVLSAVLTLLATFGIDITPLLASAGVAALAVSLGAQTVIKDFIGGLLIILENQYAVGDFISVAGIEGRVEHITLRATQVRGLNGDLHVVPNGEVRVLTNQTRDWSRVMLDVGVAYEEEMDRALSVLEAASEAFAQDPAFAPDVLEPPEVLGPVGLGDSAVNIRIAVKISPGKQWEIGRALRKAVLAACEREGVELPYPRQEVWVRTPGQESASEP
ncbi:MAG: mechanosensitive ion channel family protein [Anaerolineae bacterium]